MQTYIYPQSDTKYLENYSQSVTRTENFTLTFQQECSKITLTFQHVIKMQQAKTIAGKEFTLLNLPFYLIHRIELELDKII